MGAALPYRGGVPRMEIHIGIYTVQKMDLQISKWGNSLALRIPAEVARQFDLHEGDRVDARLTADGALSLRPGNWKRATFACELDVAREAMSMGASVIDELRAGARY